MNTFERRGDVLRFLSAEVPLLSELIHEQPGVADAIAAPFAIEVMDAGRAKRVETCGVQGASYG